MNPPAEPWKPSRKRGPQRGDSARRRRKPVKGFGMSKDIHEDRGRRQTKLARR